MKITRNRRGPHWVGCLLVAVGLGILDKAIRPARSGRTRS
jgi:hypothetical protein